MRSHSDILRRACSRRKQWHRYGWSIGDHPVRTDCRVDGDRALWFHWGLFPMTKALGGDATATRALISVG